MQTVLLTLALLGDVASIVWFISTVWERGYRHGLFTAVGCSLVAVMAVVIFRHFRPSCPCCSASPEEF